MPSFLRFLHNLNQGKIAWKSIDKYLEPISRLGFRISRAKRGERSFPSPKKSPELQR